MNITVIQPRISYYHGGGEKYPMDSILFLAQNNLDLNFTVYTTKQNDGISVLYTSFKRRVEKIENIKLVELDIPEKYTYLYEIEAGQKRYRWDMESLYFSNLVLNEILESGELPHVVWVYYLLDFPLRLNGVKTILNLLGYPRIASDYREAILSQYDLIVSLNSNIVDKWNELLAVKIKDYKTLRLGFDKNNNSNNKGIEKVKDKFDVLFVGRLIERKGIFELCELFKELVKINPNFRLFILGDGILFDKIQVFIKEKELGEHIFLLGFCEEVSAYYSTADVCVFPSFQGEGQMTSVIEALYFNGNVITTTRNGNEEYIKNGESGFLFDSSSFNELKDILLNQINGIVDVERIKKVAKTNVLENDWSKYSDNYIKICKDLLYSE